VNGKPAGASPASSFLVKAGPLVLARMFSAGLTQIIPLVLARVLAKEEYGTYFQLFLIASTLYYVLPFGVVQSLYYFVPRAEEKRPWLGQTLLYMSGAGLVAAGLVWGLLGPMARYCNNPALLDHRAALAVYTAFLLGAFPLEISLTSQGRTKHSAIVYIVSDVVRTAAMVVPCLLGFGLRGMMLAAAGFAFLRYVATWVVVPRGSTGPWGRAGLWREQLVYAAPFGVAMALSFPQQNAHLYLMMGAVAPALYAIYRVGCNQLPVVDLLYTPASEVLMVRLGELEKQGRLEEGVAAFREVASKLAFVFLPLAAFFFAAAPEFIRTFYTADYLQAVPIFRVSVLGVVLAILPMDGVLRARGHTRTIFLVYLLKAVVTVPLVWLGVRHLGMMGGIGSWALAEVVGKGALLARMPAALSTPEQPLRIREVIPWRELGKASLAAVAAGVGVFLLRAGTGSAWGGLPQGSLWHALPLALAGLLFTVGYVGVLYATGVRPLAVLASLRSRRSD
jgi:O-antigen/teichoic acid export membrane protein